MSNEELKSAITDILPEAAFDESGQWLNVSILPEDLHAFAKKLRYRKGLDMNFLFCLTCIDWKTHLTMVYHLTSTIHRHTLVLKSNLDRTDPVIQTVSDIWRTADFHEREVYDLFGVKFQGHPDLRRIFLTDDWKGFPLRKDYEDPVNMIKL